MRFLQQGRGSPPRARGKALQHECPQVGVGITPACAGKSGGVSGVSHASRDHPRVRGEKASSSMYASASLGSPPRARGKVYFPCKRKPPQGITPACAGKSAGILQSKDGSRDHPRVRGEKPDGVGAADDGPGSPPRARGKAESILKTVLGVGITPACAGKRLRNAFIAPSFTDALSKSI